MDYLILAVGCGNLDTPLNGSLTGNRTVYPNSVHFACDSGFILSGSVVRKCQANGTWDGTKTKCNGKLGYLATEAVVIENRVWPILQNKISFQVNFMFAHFVEC